MSRGTIYTVYAGDDRPAFVDSNFLEKGSGQTQFKEGYTGGKIANRVGDCGIPTISENWGARKLNGKVPNTPVDVKDSSYKGEIEFLPWGDPKGMLIRTRYLRGYNTLDYLYQNLVLNADANLSEDDSSSADAFFYVLKTGENEFDEQADPYLTLFIKNSAYNANSTSKNPLHHHFMYKEKDEAKEAESLSKKTDDKVDAILLVKAASSDNSYIRLRNLFSLVSDLVNVEVQDDLLYTTLVHLADSRPMEFMDKITGYKRSVSAIFSKGMSYGILDTTKDGVIVAGKEKKTIIAENVPEKGDNMVQWIYDNPTDPISFSAVHQLKQITEKLK